MLNFKHTSSGGWASERVTWGIVATLLQKTRFSRKFKLSTDCCTTPRLRCSLGTSLLLKKKHTGKHRDEEVRDTAAWCMIRCCLGHIYNLTRRQRREKKKLSYLSAVERKFFHWENMAYHVCLSSGMGSCRRACKHRDALARLLSSEALLRLVRQQVAANVAQLLKKRRLTQERDTIFNCQTVWIGRKEDLVCAKSIFAPTHTVRKACPHVLTSNLFTFCKCTLGLKFGEL